MPVTPFGYPLALSGCALCAFVRVFWRSFDVGPVSVLFAVGRDVRSVHACQCFARVRQIKKESLFRRFWGTQTPIKESKRGWEEREREPEWHRRRQTATKMVPKPPVENRKVEMSKTRRKPHFRGENVNKHTGKRQVSK